MSAATTVVPTPLRAFDLRVASVVDLSPHFRRVTLAGPDLAMFDDGGVLGPLDLRVKPVLPVDGTPVTGLDDLSRGWYQRWLALDPAQRGVLRTYTIRSARVRGADPQVDIDFVVHPQAGPPGPAAGWLASADVGRELQVIGPNAHARAEGAAATPGIEWQPTTDLSRGRVLLIGDETAVPAIGSILESLPRGCTGHVVIEVPTAEDFLHLPTRADLEVVWCGRGGRPRGEALTGAVREVLCGTPVGPVARTSSPTDVDVDAELLWDVAAPSGPVTAAPVAGWLAGEAGVVRELRRLLYEHRLGRGSLSAMGYWREGQSERT